MKFRELVLLVFGLFGFLIISGCEDEAPLDYIRKNYIEAYLYVGESIREIRVMKTLPLGETFVYENSFIKDAEVRLNTENESYELVFDTLNKNGYYLPDTSIKVKANTKYELFVKLTDGTEMRGETKTWDTLGWVKEPLSFIHYPKDTLDLNQKFDSTEISWTAQPGVFIYLLNVQCLDTIGYGKYLTPPTEELNRRTFSIFRDNNLYYRETTSWGLILATKTPTVWLSFKWFGKHRVKVFAVDYNMWNWFLQARGSSYNPLLSNIEGGEGVFGSASVISKEFFLFKNQP